MHCFDIEEIDHGVSRTAVILYRRYFRSVPVLSADEISDGKNARKRARRYPDKISEGKRKGEAEGARRRIKALRSSARNERPGRTGKNQRRGTEEAGGLPARKRKIERTDGMRERRTRLRETLAVSQVARVCAG